MKKNFKWMIALMFVILPCALIFSACGNIDTAIVSYNFNGGKLSEEFKTKENITSDKYATMANLDYYGGFSDGMLDEKDLEAPEGKVFAGWYLDKECTAENYLTSQTYKVLADNIRAKKGGTIYARWIDVGQKDFIYELNDETMSFNSTASKIVRFTCTKDTFASIESELPVTQNIKTAGKQEFSSWKIECNGHYYDFTTHKYDTTATNKYCSNVNYGTFNTEKINAFLADENVSYVLLRPSDLQDKPSLTITLDMNKGGVYIKSAYATNVTGHAHNSDYSFGTIGVGEYITLDTSGSFYSKLLLSVIYDIEFSDLNTLLPSGDYLTNADSGKTWQFTVTENNEKTTYAFNEENWNEYRPTRPAQGETTNVTFELV